jgi:hypothetical protein
MERRFTTWGNSKVSRDRRGTIPETLPCASYIFTVLAVYVLYSSTCSILKRRIICGGN